MVKKGRTFGSMKKGDKVKDSKGRVYRVRSATDRGSDVNVDLVGEGGKGGKGRGSRIQGHHKKGETL